MNATAFKNHPFQLNLYKSKLQILAETIAISVDEYKDIKKAYSSLRRKLRDKMNEEDGKLLTKAYELGVDAHKNQRRKSGEPYILHPIEVARICYEEIGLGPTAVISAILHDVVEDTPVTLKEINEIFGPKITKIVDGLTKLDGTYNTDQQQAENFKKVLSTLVEDVRVVLIKMADRLHNLRTIGSMPEHKKLKIAAETSYIYAPLAHRLGLYQVKTEFEDIIMQITEPDSYNAIVQKLKDTQQDRSKYINTFLKPLKKELKEMKINYRVLGRSKAISSIYNKIQKKNIPFEEIYDIFAVRIIADVPSEQEKNVCWQIYSLITDFYKPIPERLKDWVTSPKGNGYESLHTTVIGPNGRYVEVQIRSERMDDIAERGFAAHWKYKAVKNEHDVYDKWINNVRDILDTPHNDAFEFINDFKTNLFNEEVYVFTPKGDMRVLPKGSTALDFAFEIHSELGYRASAIKVNNKLVPMGHVLSNGDQITITTNKNQKPNESWLKMVITGKARSKIRSAMKEEKRKQGEIGKEALERKLKNMKINFDDNIDFIVKQFGYKSRPDLYFDLSIGKLKISALKMFEVEAGKFVLPTPEEGTQAPSDESKTKAKKEIPVKTKILINGEPGEQYDYTFASCCKPVNGDAIFGFLTASGDGLKIHRISCKNATHLAANYGYRIISAAWAGGSSTQFIVELMVIGIDYGPGVISTLSNEISGKLGINIRSFSIAGHEGYYEAKVALFVLNTDQMNMVINALGKLKGVSSVKRIDKE